MADLRRALGRWDLTAIGVNQVIGAAIFILPADVAARRIARVIDAGRAYAVVPWQMALVARAMKLMPNALYDRLFKRAGRKPRGLKL